MIPKIKKFLYTTDLSQNSAYVFAYALNSAEMHDATIDIICILPPPEPRYPELLVMDVKYPELIVPDAKHEKPAKLALLKKKLDEFVHKELKDNPARVSRVSSIQVIEGDPVTEIINKADELKADVLIMGTHSKGLIARTFLGSVATNVLQRIKIPVFMIPVPAD